MAPERENISLPGHGTLQMKSYAIAGNDIRAYYDAADKLVFVIDDTVTANKPNALLVINPVGDRKWDDILANDYGVVLETIRPKKDNKYQKLDIEYLGLDIYKDLIRDFENGAAVDDALRALASFRVTSVRRSAQARLTAALAVAETTRETIVKTNETIADLRTRAKELRTKLNRQKKSVGKEPTKQSAAKILRTESQIDATNEKLRRAERRIRNAQRRLLVAEDDAAAARAILDATANLPMTAPVHDIATVKDSLPAPAPKAGAVVAATAKPAPAVQSTPVMMSMPTFVDIDLGDDDEEDDEDVEEIEDIAPAQQLIEEDKTTLLPEPKAENMAEEEVKPLFDKDPEILDEEIAFKPIDFGTVSVPPAASVGLETAPSFAEPVSPAAPLSFAPPAGSARPADTFEDTAPQAPSSVLDTIMSVDAAPVSSEYQATPMSAAPQAAPQMDTPYQPAEPMPTDNMSTRPAPISAPVPGAAAAPARPVSPVSGAPVRPVSGGADNRRPNFLYYVMLIALIVLSIFTLWLYQRNTKDTTPDLATTSTAVEEAQQAEMAPSPFIEQEEVETVATVVEPEPAPAPEPEPEEPAIVAPVVEPEPEPEPEPQPVIDDTAPEIPVVAEPEPAPVPQEPDTPFLSEPAPEPEPEKSILVNKPVYNAGGQHDDMFVAAEEYETDVVVSPDTTIVPAPAMDTSGSDLVCNDGMAPDANGCCGGEAYTDMGDGFACCSGVTGDCYPPMF